MLRTAFFGTSDRSKPILNTLNENSELVVCVTKADVSIGRDQILKETGVKAWCKENNKTFVEINSLKNEDLQKVTESLREKQPDLIIICDFGYIIPPAFIQEFGSKLINIHFSLLPQYRGASPVQFSLLNGDKLTGVSFQRIAERVDAGELLWQIEYNIPDNITSDQLYDDMFEFTSKLIPKFLSKFEKNELHPLPQDDSKISYTYSKTEPKRTTIHKEDALIDWSEPAEKIERMIRAYNPWPIAWTFVRDMSNADNIYEGPIIFKSSVNPDSKLKIFAAELNQNKLKINEIQIEGKKRMNWKEFRNGFIEID